MYHKQKSHKNVVDHIYIILALQKHFLHDEIKKISFSLLWKIRVELYGVFSDICTMYNLIPATLCYRKISTAKSWFLLSLSAWSQKILLLIEIIIIFICMLWCRDDSVCGQLNERLLINFGNQFWFKPAFFKIFDFIAKKLTKDNLRVWYGRFYNFVGIMMFWCILGSKCKCCQANTSHVQKLYEISIK